MIAPLQTFAITGATGFLGRHLVAHFLSQGCERLRLLTREPRALEDLRNDAVTICEGDLLKPTTLQSFLEPGCTVLHLAYLNNAPEANIQAAIYLARAAKHSAVARVVHCSTALVVGFGANGIITEQSVAAPRGAYQKTKYQIEQILLRELLPSVDLAILRPTEVIGPGGQGMLSMIERLRLDSWKNDLLHCVLGARRFNYVAVANVVAALRLLACRPEAQFGEIYNVSDDDDADNHYAAVERIIGSCLNSRYKPRLGITLPRRLLTLLYKTLPAAAPPDRIYSSAKIRALGYRRVQSLAMAISELVGSLEQKSLCPESSKAR